MLFDNFEQHWELRHKQQQQQNAQENARNQINSLNVSKNELIKIFRRAFEYALW